jgi:hypothetical protein
VLLVTAQGVLVCGHQLGIVSVRTGQALVRISGVPVLVATDPEQRQVNGCPQVPPTRPCLLTLGVTRGYSELVRINGAPVVLSNLEGRTDGFPPGAVQYLVRDAGQDLVAEKGGA